MIAHLPVTNSQSWNISSRFKVKDFIPEERPILFGQLAVMSVAFGAM
jgi:hypothetical protein